MSELKLADRKLTIYQRESIYHHLRCSEASDFKKEAIEKSVTELMKLKEIVNLT